MSWEILSDKPISDNDKTKRLDASVGLIASKR